MSSLTNYEIARRFNRIGDILEIQGENPFKVRAYRRAADAIENLVEPLAEIDARGELEDVPGFGEAIAAKTRDFLRTGTTPLYTEIADTVPEGVLRMAAIPGIGPKTVKTLWEALGVTSVEALEEAARGGKVQALSGFGAAKEKKIVEAIELSRRLAERLPLYVALPYARRIVRELAERPEVHRAEVAGSIRRGRDTVGDIDLVVESSDSAKTVEAFAKIPGLTEMLESGSSEAAALSDLGLRVDLRLAPTEQFGSMLHHFSSGQAHNIHLRTLASDRGLKINEYGVFHADTDALACSGEEEANIYTALGLPYIEPELREDTGEIEAALEGRLPQLLTEADFRGQLHCHSTYSDGRASIREMARAAVELGYEYLAITDHSGSLQVAGGLSADRIREQIEEVEALNREFAGSLRILTGQEVDILADGSLDGDDEILARLDVVVGSVHIRHKENRKQMTERVVKAVENPHLDILGHPTGRLLGRREPFDVDIERVIEAAARSGTVLEINAAPERMDLRDQYARMAKEAGVRISVNTDAHSVAGLGQLFWGLCMARRAWLQPDDVINTYSYDRLRATLKNAPASS